MRLFRRRKPEPLNWVPGPPDWVPVFDDDYLASLGGGKVIYWRNAADPNAPVSMGSRPPVLIPSTDCNCTDYQPKETA